ncbi:MAG: class I SAM-dependent methyltransferase [Alkalibacterium sp.]|uniref:class I SAM-dependent DNA methyltransferase n=1 Tax=Alkalibacterium sp. TaxID=1872447 RepID=UPI003970EEAB
MTYNWFAKVYDNLMDDSLYDKWLVYTKRYIPNGEKILELGCGTGILGLKLKRDGYDITGLDLSDEMLSIAYNKQLDEGVTFPLIQGDMRNLGDLPMYPGIICYSDALCYMENEKEVLLVFKEVYNRLEENGKFLFDVHSTTQIENFLTSSFHAETENIVFMWDSFEGEYPYSVEHELSFFVNNKDNLYERFEETHKERTYPINVYMELLQEAGFHAIDVSADFKDDVSEDSKRWFFACTK